MIIVIFETLDFSLSGFDSKRNQTVFPFLNRTEKSVHKIYMKLLIKSSLANFILMLSFSGQRIKRVQYDFIPIYFITYFL